MKIIISENKLNQMIINYINDMFDVDNIHWTYATDDWGNEVDYAAQFYLGDFEDNNDLFRWYDYGYWDSDNRVFYSKSLINKWKEESPILEFEDTEKKEELDNMFSDKWHQPFKEWFMKNFKLPIKTIK